VDQTETIQYGVRANEQAIRSRCSGRDLRRLHDLTHERQRDRVITALNQRVATNLTAEGGNRVSPTSALTLHPRGSR